MSFHQSLNLPILISDPIWQSPRRGYIDTLSDEVNNFSFTLNAFRGFDQCSFNVNGDRTYMDEWLVNGLGRHVVVKNESLSVIWEGFVNRLSAKIGAKSYVVGPLLDIGNRVNVMYSLTDNLTTPPSVGIQTSTGVANDTNSQAKYGIIEKIFSQGSATDILADLVRDKFLFENSDPPTTDDDSFGQSGDIGLSIECAGYYYWLDVYGYVNNSSGEQNLSAKIQAILTAQLNSSIFSSDYTRITTNATQVNVFEDKNDRARVILEDLVSLGDSSDNAYSFGIYENRQAAYDVFPNTIEYIYRLGDEGQEIEDVNGNRIFPWNVKVAKWRRVPDFLVGRSQPTNMRKDNRNSFIISMTFNAPYGLSISGAETDELPQLLAKMQRGIVKQT